MGGSWQVNSSGGMIVDYNLSREALTVQVRRDSPAGIFIDQRSIPSVNGSVYINPGERVVFRGYEAKYSVYAITDDETAVGNYIEADVSVSGVGLDPHVLALPVISDQHHQIHLGKHFWAEAYEDSISSSTPKYWVFEAPPEGVEAHLLYSVAVSNVGILRTYHSPDLADKGTVVNNIRASNRVHQENNQAKVYRDPTVNDVGVELSVELVGSSSQVGSTKAVGGSVGRSSEIVISKGNLYLAELNVDNDGTRANIDVNWYEVDEPAA